MDELLDLLEIRKNIFVMGHSSGAQIAALIALDHKLSNYHAKICGMVGLSGPYDFFFLFQIVIIGICLDRKSSTRHLSQ